MRRFSIRNLSKPLSVGIMLMGVVHIAATFTPMIADSLALLPEGANNAFTYFSLMCGALLVLGGYVLFSLSGKVKDYPFVRKPYVFTLAILVLDGVLAVSFMPHNQFAWVILALSLVSLL